MEPSRKFRTCKICKSTEKESTVIVNGLGEKEEIEARVAQIKHQIAETTSEFDKEKCYRKDLQNWLGGVVVIRVGAANRNRKLKEAKL